MTENEFWRELGTKLHAFFKKDLFFNKTWRLKALHILEDRLNYELTLQSDQMVPSEVGFFCPKKNKVTEVSKVIEAQFTDLLKLFDAKANESIKQIDRVVTTEKMNNARAMSKQEVQGLKTEPNSTIAPWTDEDLVKLTYKQLFLMSCERLANDCISALFSKGFIELSWKNGMEAIKAISAPSDESSRLSL